MGERLVPASNATCWALCKVSVRGAIRVRRVVWGRLLARAEKREGERIMRATVFLSVPEPRRA